MSMYRIRSSWTGGNGGGLLSTVYFDTLGGTAADANTAMGAFWGALASTLSNAYTVRTEAAVFTIDEATGQPTGITAVTPVVHACTSSSEPLPFSQQAVLQLRTGTFISGRELRGRLFIPGGTEGLNTSGRPTSAFISTVNAAATTFVGSLSCEPVVYSPTKNTFDRIDVATMWTEWGVLRSRRQ